MPVNMQQTILDFGHQDFLLVPALAREVRDAVKAEFEAREAGSEATPSAKSQGFVGRAVRAIRVTTRTLRKEEMQAPLPTPDLPQTPRAPLRLTKGDDTKVAGTLLTSPCGQVGESDLDDIRISTPRAAPDWTLVEYRETAAGASLLGCAISNRLPSKDVLYFRRSGDIAQDVHFDFHVYRDGEVSRRVLSHSTWPQDDVSAETWEGVAEGEKTRYEAESFEPGVADADMIDERKQELILAYLGLSYDHLFRQGSTNDPMLISRREGGSVFLSI